MRAAIYARVSTLDQSPQNQLLELRRYAEARDWGATEYVDHGISGSRDSRPALDRMLKDVRARHVDTVIVWRLDRLGRSLQHLVGLLDEFARLGVGFISLNESIDVSTAAGKLLTHLLAAFAEFERSRIAERVRAGMARARAQGRRVGRPRKPVSDADLVAVNHLPLREAADRLGVSKSYVSRWRVSQKAA